MVGPPRAVKSGALESPADKSKVCVWQDQTGTPSAVTHGQMEKDVGQEPCFSGEMKLLGIVVIRGGWLRRGAAFILGLGQ